MRESSQQGRGERLQLCLMSDSADPSGVGEHMLTLARELRDRADVALLFADTPGARPFAARASDEGFTAVALEVENWTIEAALRRWIGEHRPDLVHAHAGVQWEGWWIADAVRQACGALTVRTEHLPYVLTKPEDHADHAAAMPAFAALICVAEGARASHAAVGPSGPEITLVRNGVRPACPTRGREAVRAELGAVSDHAVVITVARLFAQKGHAVLLEALALLAARPITLWLVGDGELRAPLQAQAAALGIADRVHFLGQRVDVPELLTAADLFVLPSLFEGLPLSVLEAMHLGTPVVATRAPGTEEALIDGMEGLLVPPGDALALAQAIARALDDPSATRERTRAARTRAAREFSAERMAAETLAVYRQVLAVAESDDGDMETRVA